MTFDAVNPRTGLVKEYRNSGEWMREVEEVSATKKEQPPKGEHWEARLKRECGLTI